MSELVQQNTALEKAEGHVGIAFRGISNGLDGKKEGRRKEWISNAKKKPL